VQPLVRVVPLAALKHELLAHRRALSRQLLMRAVAVGRTAGVFALAEPGVAAFFRGEFLWRKARAFVRAVAKRLGGRTPAGAKPVIFSRLKRHLGRRPGRNNRFCTHGANRIPRRRDKQGAQDPSVFCPPNRSRSTKRRPLEPESLSSIK